MIFMVKFHGGFMMLSAKVMFSSLYFIYVLLKINFGFGERNCDDLDILATVLDVCSSHRVANEEMPAIVRILYIGLERKVPMKS